MAEKSKPVVLASAVAFALVAGVAFTALGYVVLPWLLGAMVKSEPVREAARAYLSYRLFGVTMVEQGVSRLVSVDLGGAESLLAAE